MSANWFLVSMYLIWILGSRLIRSNNQSRSNSVSSGDVSHCRTSVFHNHFLLQLHWSSNTYSKTSWRADWTFEGTESMSFITSILSWDLWCLWSSFTGFPPFELKTQETFPRTETIKSHSSRSKPSNLNPVSREIISDSVELWETAVCFLHIQLIGTNVWLPKTHNVPPEVDFESSRSPAKSESWNSPKLHCLAVFPTRQYCL